MQECFKNYMNNYQKNNNIDNYNCIQKPQNPSEENMPNKPTTKPIIKPEQNNCNQCVIDKIGYAEAYIPYQEDTQLMSESQSFTSGTVFEALSMPYEKGSALMRFNEKE